MISVPLSKNLFSIFFWIFFWTIIHFTNVAASSDLLLLTDVKSFATAHAITSQQKGFSSISTNPAGIAAIREFQLETRYSTYYDNDLGVYAISFGKKIANLSVAITIPYKSITGIPETTTVSGKGKQTGTFSDTETGVILSVGTQLNRYINIGVNLNGFYHDVYDRTAYFLGLDFGIQFQHRVVQLGVSIQNVPKGIKHWTNGTTEEINQTIRVGAGFNLNRHNTVLIQIESDTFSANTTKSSSRTTPYIVQAGYTFKLDDLLEIGLGMQDITHEPLLTYGVSIRAGKIVEIQYAGGRHDSLGMIHKIGMNLAF